MWRLDDKIIDRGSLHQLKPLSIAARHWPEVSRLFAELSWLFAELVGLFAELVGWMLVCTPDNILTHPVHHWQLQTG
jgi:hypothetical protein